jgi:hypothetical protein
MYGKCVLTAPLSTDLLAVWTDPDTAMEAVGSGLGLFDEAGPSPARALASDERLRNTLFDVLLSLVEGGALEMRPCGGGRHAFRWRDGVLDPAPEPATVTNGRPNGNETNGQAPSGELLHGPLLSGRRAEPAVFPVPVPPVAADVPVVAEISAPTPGPGASRPIMQAPLLVVPALSCLLAVLCYLWLGTGIAIAVVGVMFVAGVVGLIRRVPFAGAWLVGIVVAGALLRFS